VINAIGASQQIATVNRGYVGVGSLSYQWQRSAADSDADYSNIGGAITESYDDTGAPADGSGRYYKAILNATGATQQSSSVNRGYRDAGSTPATPTAYWSLGIDLANNTIPIVFVAGILLSVVYLAMAGRFTLKTVIWIGVIIIIGVTLIPGVQEMLNSMLGR
jgi:hypothetical protein